MSIDTTNPISSGVKQLDQLLGGLAIGDNVIWYDVAGSMADIFCMNFIRISHEQSKPFIYVSFDRSPKNLVTKLGPLAKNQYLTILDCFTHGKGDGSEVFSQFYEKDGAQWPYQIIQVKEPWKPDMVMEAIYGLHNTMQGDVRFVFESLTGMQDLWGGEEHVLKFYSHSCPRLYELDTVAYWVVEKGAHSERLKAHINQIAQVAIDLSIKRGKSALTVLKAENRRSANISKPNPFWCDKLNIHIEEDHRHTGAIELGPRLKQLRTRQGISQKELAGLVGVTPSTISQIESNIIYPSLPALFKIAESLSVGVGTFFGEPTGQSRQVVFPSDAGIDVSFPELPRNSITGRLVTPMDFKANAEIYFIDIPADTTLPSHFFTHKGEEIGHLLSGTVELTLGTAIHHLQPGDTVYLTAANPTRWKNTGNDAARFFWIKC